MAVLHLKPLYKPSLHPIIDFFPKLSQPLLAGVITATKDEVYVAERTSRVDGVDTGLAFAAVLYECFSRVLLLLKY